MQALRNIALTVAAGILAGGVFEVQPLRASAPLADGPGWYCLQHPATGECAPTWIHTCWCTPL